MSDSLVKKEPDALAAKPLEWLGRAKEDMVLAFQNVSRALLQDCDAAETADIHNWVKDLEASAKMFKDNSRERLLAFILEKGSKVTEKGTLELDLGNGFVQRAIPTNTKPNNKLTEQMLRAKGLPLNEHMDQYISYEASDYKLRQLLDSQQITKNEYQQCFEQTAYRIGKTEKKSEDEE